MLARKFMNSHQMLVMETIHINDDIKVLYSTAKSFPEGIMDAFNELQSKVPASKNRIYYGISRPENGHITYKAAVEELYNGEAEKLGFDKMVIKKGLYSCSTIKDFMKNTPEIGKAFQELLTSPNLDPNGYCVEWYLNDQDVICMVRLNDEAERNYASDKHMSQRRESV
jgi:predicted transcriptional regulator YdeE